MMTWSETAHAFCRKAAARLFVNEVLGKIYSHGLKIIQGCDADMGDLAERLNTLDLRGAIKGYLKDMNLVAAELVQSSGH